MGFAFISAYYMARAKAFVDEIMLGEATSLGYSQATVNGASEIEQRSHPANRPGCESLAEN